MMSDFTEKRKEWNACQNANIVSYILYANSSSSNVLRTEQKSMEFSEFELNNFF